MTWQSDLDDAIQNAFTLDEFRRLLWREGKRQNEYAGLAFPEVRAAVIDAAEREGWVRDLVRAALKSTPGNGRLKRFREERPEFAPTSLKQTEVAELRRGLESAFPTYPRLAALISDRLGGNLDVLLERGAEPPPVDYVERLILAYDARGSIDEIVDAALESIDPVLLVAAKSVRAALRQREAAAGFRRPSPTEACMVNDRVFVDRDTLRSALGALAPTPRKPIVAVNGPARSGKSHTLELVRYFATQQKGLEVVAVDLKEEQHARYHPGALARSIAFQMGRAASLQYLPREADASSAARWSRDLCDWLIGEVRQSDKTWIIALDGFYHPDLPEQTRDMVRELVRRAAAADSRLRVVLLHYSNDLLPTDLLERIAPEDIAPATDEVLRAYLPRLFDQEGIDADEDAVEDVIADVRAKAPNADIKVIADVIQQWVEHVTGRGARL